MPCDTGTGELVVGVLRALAADHDGIWIGGFYFVVVQNNDICAILRNGFAGLDVVAARVRNDKQPGSGRDGNVLRDAVLLLRVQMPCDAHTGLHLAQIGNEHGGGGVTVYVRVYNDMDFIF